MIWTRVVRPALGALVALTAACAAARPGAPSPARLAPDVGLYAIGPRALGAEGGRSLYDVITRYWPNVRTPVWAQRFVPAAAGVEPLGVYVDGAPAGSLEMLRDVQASRIARVRRISPIEEFHTFGRQHPAGALLVEWVKP